MLSCGIFFCCCICVFASLQFAAGDWSCSVVEWWHLGTLPLICESLLFLYLCFNCDSWFVMATLQIF